MKGILHAPSKPKTLTNEHISAYPELIKKHFQSLYSKWTKQRLPKESNFSFPIKPKTFTKEHSSAYSKLTKKLPQRNTILLIPSEQKLS